MNEKLKRILREKIPLDLGGHRSSGIYVNSYIKLEKSFLKDVNPPKVFDVIQQLAYPSDFIINKFNIDIIDAGRGFLKKRNDWKKNKFINNNQNTYLIPRYVKFKRNGNNLYLIGLKEKRCYGVKPENSKYFNQCFWIYKNEPEIPYNIKEDDIDKHMWAMIPSPPFHLDIFKDKQLDLFIKALKDLYESTEKIVCLDTGISIFENACFLRGMENFLMDLYLDKKGAERLINAISEHNFKIIEKVVDSEIKDFVDVLVFSDDISDDKNTLIPYPIFKKFFKKHYEDYYDYIHSRTNCSILLHSCGSIFDFIPSFIEIGLDMLNPVQITANKMNPKELVKQFGKDLIFWGGGCDTRFMLPRSNPKVLKENVKKLISIFSKGKGYIFAATHNILDDTPTENIIAMLEAVNELNN